jgi:hypothetical protein
MKATGTRENNAAALRYVIEIGFEAHQKTSAKLLSTVQSSLADLTSILLVNSLPDGPQKASLLQSILKTRDSRRKSPIHALEQVDDTRTDCDIDVTEV